MIEYRGDAIRKLSMEGRMTVCNMSIEGGARAGMIAPDDTTFAFLEGRKHSPRGAEWERALDDWRALATDERREFRRGIARGRRDVRPAVTWGTNPAQSVSIDGVVPDPAVSTTTAARQAAQRALAYMGLQPGTASGTSAWTLSLSARALTAGSRTCGPRPRSARPQGARRGARPGRARARPG